MKKLIVLLAVVALCAGTAQAFTWDLIDDDFGSNQDGSADDCGWYVHPFTVETLLADYSTFDLATGSTTSDLVASNVGGLVPATFTIEFRTRQTVNGGNRLFTGGTTTNPAPDEYFKWYSDTWRVRVKEQATGTSSYTPDNSYQLNTWYTYTYVVETGAVSLENPTTTATDRWRVWIDDPTLSGAPALTLEGTIAGQPSTSGSHNELWFDTDLDHLMDLDYFKMGEGVIPEPATLAILGLGGALALLRRRK